MERHILDTPSTSTILDAAKLIGRSLEPGETITGMLKLLDERLGLEAGRVLLPGRKTGDLQICYRAGLNSSEQIHGSCDIDEGVAARVLAKGEVAVITNDIEEPLYLARITTGTRINGPVAYIAMPIMQNDAPVGVVAVHPRDTGTREFGGHLYVLQVLAAMTGQVLQIHNLVETQTAELVNACAKTRSDTLPEVCTYGILGKSLTLRKAGDKALRAAQSDATVLMVGASGCGKERFARMIHLASDRRDGPFVCINCAAIPQELLESELFGHEKGAFTGAISTRPGKFELASRGTLFLDEIGDMNIDLQAKLLRALQEKTIQRVGGHAEIESDARIIAATNRDLEQVMKEGGFRLDLYFRLNVLKINLPPLSERQGDIRLLALYFLNRENQRYQRNLALSGRALEKLESYDWPGNIRQLENVIERAVIMAENDLIYADDIDIILEEEPDVGFTNPDAGEATNSFDLTDASLRPYLRVRTEDRQNIENALRRARGNKTLAAKFLGLTARQLHYRLEKLGISCVEQ